MGERETVELECEHCGDLVKVARESKTSVCPACGETFDVNLPPSEDRSERKRTMRFRKLPKL